MMRDEFIAHYNKETDKIQTVEEHLTNTASLTAEFANRIGCETLGKITGLFHDLGKYTDLFNCYIQSSTALIDEEDDKYIEPNKYKGKIDHASAGAIEVLSLDERKDQCLSLMVASLIIKSHHGGLRNVLSVEGENLYIKYISKKDEETRRREAIANFLNNDKLFRQKNKIKIDKAEDEIKAIVKKIKGYSERNRSSISFQIGLFVKYLYSCLIDADRIDTADFEDNERKIIREKRQEVNWESLSKTLENHITGFQSQSKINQIRKQISECCMEKANMPSGIYKLQVPTGGGKTLSAIRFAINHAKKHKLKRIIMVLPFISIIDQNADVYRQIFERKINEKWTNEIVLEHHSNLTSDKSSKTTKLLSENWDAPIVLTTMVQFLESVFSGGTVGIRRMHQMAESVIIFDEVQSIPPKTMVMFNQLINFLVNITRTTIVLCTATQPLLDRLPDDVKEHSLNIPKDNEIITNADKLYTSLKRVEVNNCRKNMGWSNDEIQQFIIDVNQKHGATLVIVNTKASATALYKELEKHKSISIYHLSTAMCPEHRREVLKEIKEKLLLKAERSSVICISTQLIESGVDIDFDAAIRYIAGMDSIVQAAGRCNRNGENREYGQVYIINPKDENIARLNEIKLGIDATNRLLNEFEEKPEFFDYDLLSIISMNRYYQIYYEFIKEKMKYPVKNQGELNREDNIYDLYASNMKSVEAYKHYKQKEPQLILRQSFATAGDLFHVIDGGQVGVIVPYKGGKEIITKLCVNPSFKQMGRLLVEAQRYSINIYENMLDRMLNEGMLHAINMTVKDENFGEIRGLYYLDEAYYDMNIGLNNEQKCSILQI